MRTGLLAAFIMAAGMASAADAPAKPPCENFPWPTARERAAFSAEPTEVLSGATLETIPAGAVTMALVPLAEAALPLAPERAPKDAAAARGGWIALPAPAAGAYQVSIDGPHWVDAIQGGKALQSAAHGSDPTCTLFHKSVRFELTNEPLILQFSGEDTDRVAFTIMPAE